MALKRLDSTGLDSTLASQAIDNLLILLQAVSAAAAAAATTTTTTTSTTTSVVVCLLLAVWGEWECYNRREPGRRSTWLRGSVPDWSAQRSHSSSLRSSCQCRRNTSLSAVLRHHSTMYDNTHTHTHTHTPLFTCSSSGAAVLKVKVNVNHNFLAWLK